MDEYAKSTEYPAFLSILEPFLTIICFSLPMLNPILDRLWPSHVDTGSQSPPSTIPTLAADDHIVTRPASTYEPTPSQTDTIDGQTLGDPKMTDDCEALGGQYANSTYKNREISEKIEP